MEIETAEIVEDDAPTADAARAKMDNPWVLLATLFFVTAALGLPFLWMSRAFGPLMKSVLTLAVLAWTVLILYLFWLVMAWSIGRIMEVM